MRRRVGEQIISACLVPTLKHVGDLIRIQGTLNQHGYHSILQWYTLWLALSGTIICFSTGQWPNTHPGCVRAIWPRRVMECCIRWPGLHNHPTSTQLRCLGWKVKEKQSTSAEQTFDWYCKNKTRSGFNTNLQPAPHALFGQCSLVPARSTADGLDHRVDTCSVPWLTASSF